VCVDAQILSEIGKDIGKEAPLVTEYPKDEPYLYLQTDEYKRAVLAVKLIQLLKLKKDAQKSTIALMVRLLNVNLLVESRYEQKYFHERLYEAFDTNKVYPNEKERYILNSTPHIKLAVHGLWTYKCKQISGYLNAMLALQMETDQFPLDFFNEYTLSLRGKTTQGVTLFKNRMLALIDKSKVIQAKSDIKQTYVDEFDAPKRYNLHC